MPSVVWLTWPLMWVSCPSRQASTGRSLHPDDGFTIHWATWSQEPCLPQECVFIRSVPHFHRKCSNIIGLCFLYSAILNQLKLVTSNCLLMLSDPNISIKPLQFPNHCNILFYYPEGEMWWTIFVFLQFSFNPFIPKSDWKTAVLWMWCFISRARNCDWSRCIWDKIW